MMVIAIFIGMIDKFTIDDPTKLVRQEAILGGLSIGQMWMSHVAFKLVMFTSWNMANWDVCFRFNICISNISKR